MAVSLGEAGRFSSVLYFQPGHNIWSSLPVQPDISPVLRGIAEWGTFIFSVELSAVSERIMVSVQREPSGHNLKHPTKWCPPNK